MTPIRFTVIGEAEPQGSAKILPIRRKFPLVLKTVRDLMMSVVITSDNDRLKAWRQAVAAAAHAACFGVDAMPIAGAVALEAVFHVAPPQHIPKNRGGLPIVRDDVDKLARAIADACSGIVYEDDAQIVDLLARKRYAETPARARVDIAITPITVGLPFPAERTNSHGHTRDDGDRFLAGIPAGGLW